jgi:RNA polymerase sigma-70 factor (ECF subfamily)
MGMDGASRGPQSPSEALDRVVRAARRGDPDAWDQLYRALAGRVVGYLRMQRAAEPEDLTSEVFLAVFRNIGSFSGSEAQFRAWVFVTAHRRLLDERRRLGRRDEERMALAMPPSAGDTEEEALRALGTEHVEELCARLSADQRAVLLLRLVGDLSVEQVAEVLGKSSGAVKALQHRAIAALSRIAEREGVPG